MNDRPSTIGSSTTSFFSVTACVCAIWPLSNGAVPFSFPTHQTQTQESAPTQPHLPPTHKRFHAMASNFKVVQEIDVKGHKITKFRSSKTGLSVLHIDNEGLSCAGSWARAQSRTPACGQERACNILTLINPFNKTGPIVNGYFTLATECKKPRTSII